jgi:hypothetical protein
MKPPYIKLYVKDFAFEIQGMTKKQIGEYMLKFLEAYRQESVPDEFSEHSIFSELQNSLENYEGICEKNRKNGSKNGKKITKNEKKHDHGILKNNDRNFEDNPTNTTDCESDWLNSGYPEKSQKEPTLVNQEPITNNQELEVKKKNIKKKKAPSAESEESAAPLDIPSYIPEDLLLDFFQHRKNIKKPMSHRAKELLISKIINLYNDGNDPTKLLETAIERGWQTVYETKETNGRKSNAENWNSGNGTNGAEYQPFNGHQQDQRYATRLSDYERKMLYVRRNLGLST